MGFFKRLFGICSTRPPADAGCWSNQVNHVVIDAARAPELGSPGGAVRLEGQGLSQRILVIRGDDGKAHAFVNTCTHRGRRIDPLPGTSAVRCCSVGKATFTFDGKIVSGPAKGPLTVLAVREEAGRIIVLLTPSSDKGKSDSMVGTSVARG